MVTWRYNNNRRRCHSKVSNMTNITTTTCRITPPLNDFEKIIGSHDKALKLAKQGLELLYEATQAGGGLGLSSAFSNVRWYSENFVKSAMQEVEKNARKQSWRKLLEKSNLASIMAANDIQKIEDQLEDNPPKITRKTVISTFIELFDNRRLSFERGLVDLFKSLSGKFKSHDPFKINKKIILTNCFTHGNWVSYSSSARQLNDLNRIMLVLSDKDPGSLKYDEQLSEKLSQHAQKSNEDYTDEYFKCKIFMNGNIHIWLLKKELINEANKIIAEYYGKSLPDK